MLAPPEFDGTDEAISHFAVRNCPPINDLRQSEVRGMAIQLVRRLRQLGPQERTIPLLDTLLCHEVRSQTDSDGTIEDSWRAADKAGAAASLLISKLDLMALNHESHDDAQKSVLADLQVSVDSALGCVLDRPAYALQLLSPKMLQSLNLPAVFPRHEPVASAIHADLNLAVYTTRRYALRRW
jgi:hypothetical protein